MKPVEDAGWEAVEPDVWRLSDSCHVYAVRGPAGTVLVNAGTGLAADRLGTLPSPGPYTLLLTHHFRDHSDGAVALQAAGVAEVLGNYTDRDLYTDPEQHFRERVTWVGYQNWWDRFAPIRPLPVTGWLYDYETRSIAGLTWEVVPTPGHSPGASSYVAMMPDGRRLAFVGETICGPGRVARVAPLQYNYNDLDGAFNLWHSCDRLLAARPDRLYPSLGEPVTDPPAAVAAFKANLRRIDEMLPGFASGLPAEDSPATADVEEVTLHLLRSPGAFAETHFLVSESGRVLALDYGYYAAGIRTPAPYGQPPHSAARRPLLHGLAGLKRRFGIDRINAVLVSHYHDDHVAGIPLLQRLFGTEVWAGENFADILERPERYDRPCLWYEPIPVTRRLPLGETVEWEGIPITLHAMSGHTRFSTLICLEVDGVRVAHTGDQIFFQPWEFGPGAKLFTNHVYKNGLDLGCYQETLEHLRRFRPELILTGHTKPYRVTPEWWGMIESGARAFDEVHRALMPLGEDDIYFGPESQPAKLKPYHAHSPDGGALVFEGWVLNPFPSAQTAVLRLVAPDGWASGVPLEIPLAPRGRAAFSLTLTPPPGTVCRRQPVALDMIVGGQPFGQVAEALVTVGTSRF